MTYAILPTRKSFLSLLVLISVSISGCITHHVSGDYPEYLQRHPGRIIGKAPFEAEYELTENAKNRELRIHSGTVGIANVWTVNVGDLLEGYLNSGDLQNAFGKLHGHSGNSVVSDLLIFDVVKFEFKNYSADISFNIAHFRNGKKISTKIYGAVGGSELGKMTFGGPFAMKHSIQQSMTESLDKILGSFISDLNSGDPKNEVLPVMKQGSQ